MAAWRPKKPRELPIHRLNVRVIWLVLGTRRDNRVPTRLFRTGTPFGWGLVKQGRQTTRIVWLTIAPLTVLSFAPSFTTSL